jgi:hypothetical protein
MISGLLLVSQAAHLQRRATAFGSSDHLSQSEGGKEGIERAQYGDGFGAAEAKPRHRFVVRGHDKGKSDGGSHGDRSKPNQDGMADNGWCIDRWCTKERCEHGVRRCQKQTEQQHEGKGDQEATCYGGTSHPRRPSGSPTPSKIELRDDPGRQKEGLDDRFEGMSNGSAWTEVKQLGVGNGGSHEQKHDRQAVEDDESRVGTHRQKGAEHNGQGQTNSRRPALRPPGNAQTNGNDDDKRGGRNVVPRGSPQGEIGGYCGGGGCSRPRSPNRHELNRRSDGWRPCSRRHGRSSRCRAYRR